MGIWVQFHGYHICSWSPLHHDDCKCDGHDEYGFHSPALFWSESSSSSSSWYCSRLRTVYKYTCIYTIINCRFIMFIMSYPCCRTNKHQPKPLCFLLVWDWYCWRLGTAMLTAVTPGLGVCLLSWLGGRSSTKGPCLTVEGWIVFVLSRVYEATSAWMT